MSNDENNSIYKKTLQKTPFEELYYLQKILDEQQTERDKKIKTDQSDSPLIIEALYEEYDLWEGRLSFVEFEISTRILRLFELGDNL